MWSVPSSPTRRDRANKVRKRDYFTKYGEQARLVLDSWLDQYADEGIEDLEDKAVLEVPPCWPVRPCKSSRASRPCA